jgi:hypothetical protein
MARADRPHARRATRTHALPLSNRSAAVVLAVAFLGGAVAATSVAQDMADAAAVARARADLDRADRAATVRLTAQAAHYAAAREHEARQAAMAALDEAEAVLVSAPELVGEATVAPLEGAVTELAELVEDLEPPVIDPAAVSPVSDTVPTAAAGGTPDAAPDRAAPGNPAPGGSAPAEGATRAPAAPQLPGDADPEATALALAGVRGDVPDLEASDELLAAAERVAALATQVEALRDVVAGELAQAEEAAQARRAEQEAKREAARQAAWEAAAAAPNGRIPAHLLCRPGFADALVLCEAAQALDALNGAYRADTGSDLGIVSGYRTLDQQYDVRATRGGLAATPGTSNHGRGLAVDFANFGGVGQFDDPDYLWMVENGPRFGWVHPPSMGPGGSGPLEPWHWEYAGH